MDRIFRKTTSIFTLVQTTKNEPHMYGKNGELLRSLDDVEDAAVRQASKAHKEHHEKGSDETVGEERA